MLFGHFAADNVIALVGGLIAVAVGIALFLKRGAFERAASDFQRQMGRLGRKVASRPQRWATVVVALDLLRSAR